MALEPQTKAFLEKSLNQPKPVYKLTIEQARESIIQKFTFEEPPIPIGSLCRPSGRSWSSGGFFSLRRGCTCLSLTLAFPG